MTLSLPLYTQDQSYPPWLLRRFMKTMRTPGVANPNTDFIVTAASGLQVSISAGDAFVAQTVESIEPSISDVGVYYVYNDGAVNPANTISAPLTNPRVDQVVLRVYDAPEQGLGIASKAQVEWVVGAETAGATLSNLSGVAALPSNSLRLVYVLQTVGELSISSGNIQNAAPSSVVSPILNFVASTVSLTVQAGTVTQMSNGGTTATLPTSPPGGTICGVRAGNGVSGASPVTVASAAGMYGLGLNAATSFTLGTPQAHVLLIYDAANTSWRIISGEQDTGWVGITMTIGTAGTPAPQARKVGDSVSTRGQVVAAVGGLGIDLPDSSWRPAVDTVCPLVVVSSGGGAVPAASLFAFHGGSNIGNTSGALTSTDTYSLDAGRWSL